MTALGNNLSAYELAKATFRGFGVDQFHSVFKEDMYQGDYAEGLSKIEQRKVQSILYPVCDLRSNHKKLGDCFCKSCGASSMTEQQREYGVNEYRVVVSADISGFTAFSAKHTPDEIIEYVNEFIWIYESEMIRFGGIPYQRNGDEAGGTFWVMDRDTAIRASQNALEVFDRYNRENPDKKIHLKIGISEGEVFVMEDQIVGRAMEEAQEAQATLSQAGISHGMAVHQTMVKKVRHLVSSRNAADNNIIVTGLRAGVSFLRIDDFIPAERVEDARQLHRIYSDRVEFDNKLAMVSLSGKEGTAKVMTLARLLSLIRSEEVTLLNGGANRYQPDPLKNALKSYIAKLDGGNLTEESLRKYVDEIGLLSDPIMLGELGGSFDENLIVSVLASYLGIEIKNNDIITQNLMRDYVRMLRTIKTIVSRLVGRIVDEKGKLILVFFDINEMDDESKEILRYVTNYNKDKPILLLGIQDVDDNEFTWENHLADSENEEKVLAQTHDIYAETLNKESVKAAILFYLQQEGLTDLSLDQINKETVDAYYKFCEGNLAVLRIVVLNDWHDEPPSLRREASGDIVLIRPPSRFAELDAMLVARVKKLSHDAQRLFKSIALLTHDFDDRFSVDELPEYHSYSPLRMTQALAELEKIRFIGSVGVKTYRLAFKRAFSAQYRQFDERERRHHGMVDHLLAREAYSARDYALIAFHAERGKNYREAFNSYLLAIDLSCFAQQFSNALRYLNSLESLLIHFSGSTDIQYRLQAVSSRVKIMSSRKSNQEEWREALTRFEQNLASAQFEALDEVVQRKWRVEFIIQMAIYLVIFDSRNAPGHLKQKLEEFNLNGDLDDVGIDVDIVMKARLFNVFAVSYSRIEKFEEAENYYKLARRYAAESQDNQLVADVELGFGSLLLRQGKYEESLAVSKATARLFKEIGDMRGIFRVRINQANAYRGLRRYDQAVSAFELLYSELEDSEDNLVKSYCLLNWGITCLEQGKLSEARKQIQRALKHGGDHVVQNYGRTFMAMTYVFSKPKKALKDLESLADREFLNQINAMPTVAAAYYFALALSHYKVGNLRTAYLFLDQAKRIRDLNNHIEDVDADLVFFYDHFDEINTLQEDDSFPPLINLLLRKK